MKNFSLKRRGLSNPFVWMVPLAMGTPVVLGLIAFGSGSQNENYFIISAAAVALGIVMVPTLAYGLVRTVRIDERAYEEGMSILGWTLWSERYSIDSIDKISIQSVVWGEDRDMYQLNLNLRNGQVLPSFVFIDLAEAERTMEQMNAVIDHA